MTKFQPQEDHYYFRSKDGVAFCEPCFSQSIVPEEYRPNMLITTKTMEEWKQVFADYAAEANVRPSVASGSTTKYLFPNPARLELKTPRKAQPFNQAGYSVDIPVELEEIKNQSDDWTPTDWWWDQEDSSALSSPSLLAFLQNVRSFLLRYDVWLQEPSELFSHCMDTVEGDLHRLKQHCDALQLSLGRPITLRDSEFPDVWSAIEFILSKEGSSEDLGDI